jgi:uncharacterized protein (TIGR03083 family)
MPQPAASRCQTDRVEHAGYIEAIRRDGDRVARVTPADIDVPTCPGWTLFDLYHHLGSVHRWQVAQLDADDTSRLQPAPPVDLPTDPDDLVDWFIDGVDLLVDRLTAVGADAEVPTWFGPRRAQFWARRAAHETAMHRWDLQAAVASPEPIERSLAVDGIDELLEIMVPRRVAKDPWPDPAATIHLHATDGEPDDGQGEWMIELDGAEVTVRHEHGKGDVAVRAAASDLLLVLAGRLPHSRLESFGDATVIDRWHATVHL